MALSFYCNGNKTLSYFTVFSGAGVISNFLCGPLGCFARGAGYFARSAFNVTSRLRSWIPSAGSTPLGQGLRAGAGKVTAEHPALTIELKELNDVLWLHHRGLSVEYLYAWASA